MNKYKLLILVLSFSGISFAAFTEPDRALLFGRNLLTNPGWESSKANWTASGGTYTTTTTAANRGSGNLAADWNSNGASQTLISTAVAIPAGSYLANGVASCRFKAATGTATHKIQAYDGTNVLAEASITSSSTSYPRTSVNFLFPSSGNIQLRVISVASDEPQIYIDDCFLGLAEGFNVASVSQSTLYGAAFWPATTNCQWTRSATTWGGFTADSDCTSPTAGNLIGNASAPATKIPGITFSTLPPGEYLLIASGVIYATGTNTSVAFRWHDGTNSLNGIASGVMDATLATVPVTTVLGRVRYTTSQSNITFQLQNNDLGGGAGGGVVDARLADISIFVYRYPTDNELAYRPENISSSWSGYHDSTCSWSRTNTAYGDPAVDSTCNFVERTNRNFGTVTSYLSGSDKLPGFVFSPARTGRKFVCARINQLSATANASLSARLSDTSGTVIVEGQDQPDNSNGNAHPLTLCGIYDVTSMASRTIRIELKASTGSNALTTFESVPAIEWNIFDLDSAFSAPIIAGSVVSGSSAVENLERVSVTSTCSSGTCTIASSTAGISSITRSAPGTYTLNILSGRFSAAPTCVGTSNGQVSFLEDSTATTSTAYSFYLINSGFARTDGAFDIVCMGPK